jgi:hypothetical protein
MRENMRRPEENKPFPFHGWLAQNWIGHSDYLAAGVCKKLLTAQETQRIKLVTKFAHNEQKIAQ